MESKNIKQKNNDSRMQCFRVVAHLSLGHLIFKMEERSLFSCESSLPNTLQAFGFFCVTHKSFTSVYNLNFHRIIIRILYDQF